MSWLKRIISFFQADTNTDVESEAKPNPIIIRVSIDPFAQDDQAPDLTPIPREKAPPKPWQAWKQATVERAMRLSGMVTIDDAAISYFKSKAAAGFINYKSLVRDGDIMSSEQKKAAGLKTRAYVGDLFSKHLNEAGKLDPVEAACRIAFILNQQQSALAGLNKPPHFLDGDTRRQFFPSVMAAGPCPHAERLRGQLIQPWDADVVPFDDCTHPDQCACTYESKDFKV